MIKNWLVQNNLIGYYKKYWVRVLKNGAGFAFAKIISKRPQWTILFERVVDK